MKKKFKDIGFGKFCGRVIKNFPNLASDVVKIVTSGNPVGVAIKKVGDLLSTNAIQEERAKKDLVELEKFQDEWDEEMYRL